MKCSKFTSILLLVLAASSTSALKLQAPGSVLETNGMSAQELQTLRESGHYTNAVLSMILPKNFNPNNENSMNLLMQNTKALEMESTMLHAFMKQEATYRKVHTSKICSATDDNVGAKPFSRSNIDTCGACVKSKCAMPQWYVLIGPLYKEEYCNQLYVESCNDCGRGGLHCWGNDKEAFQFAQQGTPPLSPVQFLKDSKALYSNPVCKLFGMKEVSENHVQEAMDCLQLVFPNWKWQIEDDADLSEWKNEARRPPADH